MVVRSDRPLSKQGSKGVSASKLNPQTLQPDDNGIYISPAHIHLAIREKLGILESPNSQQFSFGDDIELLETYSSGSVFLGTVLAKLSELGL